MFELLNEEPRGVATEAIYFAGLRISGIYTSPRAVGIEGVGTLAFG